VPTIIASHSGTSSLAGQTQRFGQERLRIGRRPENDIHFDPTKDHAVSGNHAEVWISGGVLHIKDLASQNGTFINGTKLDGESTLRPGDVVRFGQAGPELRFTIEDGAAASAPTGGKQTVGINTLEKAITRATLSERRKSRGALVVAISAVVLIGGVAGFLYWQTQQKESERLAAEQQRLAGEVGSTRQVAEQAKLAANEALTKVETTVKDTMARYEQELGGLKGKLTDGEGKVARLIVELQSRDQVLEAIRKRQDLSEEDRKKMIAETEARMTGLRDQLKSSETSLREEAKKSGASDWASLVDGYQDSVFLCLVQSKPNEEGQYSQGTGTAFAIRADGLLATNAHVAKMYMDDADNISTAVVIQNHTGKVFPVRRVMAHPDWNGNPAGPDVALLQIDTKGTTMVPFKLADDARLKALRIGTQLGTMGYPGELGGAYLSAVDNKKGEVLSALATFKDGWVGRITDYERKRAEFADSRFIQHSASLSGGTSGSPMFDRDGFVIGLNNSGLDMFVKVTRSDEDSVERTPSAAEIGNAIRVDVLRELLTKSGW